MSWFLVDDKFHGHDKVLALLELPDGLQAIGLWTLCGSWSRDHKRAGFVPDAVVHAMAGKCPRTSMDGPGRVRTASDASELAGVLVSKELWTRVEGGYQFHDWDDIYKLEDKDAQRKRKDADRKRAERALKKLQADVGANPRTSMDGPWTPGDGDGTDGSGSYLEGSTRGSGSPRLVKAGGAR